MKNPFIKISQCGAQFTDASCSINRVQIAKLPVYGVEDKIEGKAVSEIFSVDVITEDIKKNADALEIELDKFSERGLIFEFVKKISDGSEAAISLMRKYGRRLGMIFLTLKTGLPENQNARSDWNQGCWEYWKSVKRVILVGGLTSGVMGTIMKAEALSVFEQAGVEPYEFILFDNASFVGIMGAAAQIKEKDGTFIVFDFGQTNLKRSIVKKRSGEIVEVKMLDSLPSKYMQKMKADDSIAQEEAQKLDLYLRRCIADTIGYVSHSDEISGEIIISIANYVCDGSLNAERGGYAKLKSICDNYGEYLENELSGQLRKRVSVRLIHDSTAAALYFCDYNDSVCITIGTAFGIGFPEIQP
ncbi:MULTISPECIES: hypothetical protein [unclassified Ruminococcus]|uniref:hypothetical protein n=1 Tax=unclassified Ruminococcus TaxID=2608920 RepID=UPI00210EDF42|nr:MULTISPECIES: hypothetical protein [unclassified Ruminococcus]MCQ4021903.1 hypothetical protein [Ruminococcus sp. zg-924]MCQ4114348.1 hypothetical protein [Ruminococcus sp. zg-921]